MEVGTKAQLLLDKTLKGLAMKLHVRREKREISYTHLSSVIGK